MWYNEALLAPFFLEHYSYADEILVLLDTDTSDATFYICCMYPNVKIEPFAFEAGFDDNLKQAKINEVVLQFGKDFDWIFALDADEFIFPSFSEEPRKFLDRQKGNVIWAKMWQVYRHETDSDLDYLRLPTLQRRHGDPLLRGFNAAWNKPVIVRSEIEPVWKEGCHSLLLVRKGKIERSKYNFVGAHWANADPDMAVVRRLASRQRQSPNNLRIGRQVHNHRVTEAEIRHLCKKHEKDPELF